MSTQVGVTLYNLREYCKTADGLRKSLELLRKCGCVNVQVSGVPLEPAEIRKALDEFGMHCCTTHEGYDAMNADPGAICDKLDTLGCDFTALGAAPELYRSHLGMTELTGRLNDIGRKLAARGKMLGYHNHHFEFDRKGGERILFATLLEHADPEILKLELDVAWLTRGGSDPAVWLRRFAGRTPVVHLKDFTILNGEPTFCEIGEGNLNWHAIIPACFETGVKFAVIEQDTPFPGRSIFDSMAISLRNAAALDLK